MKDRQRRSHRQGSSGVKMANAEPLNCNKYVSIPLRLATRAKFEVPRRFPCNREAFLKDCMLSCCRTGIRERAYGGYGW